MKRIYVGNLAYNTSEQQLEELLGGFGNVLNVSIMRDRVTGQSRGFAFVDMEDDGAADRAIAELNGTQLDGRALTVNEARPREQRGGGSSGPRSGGYGRSRSRDQ